MEVTYTVYYINAAISINQQKKIYLKNIDLGNLLKVLKQSLYIYY